MGEGKSVSRSEASFVCGRSDQQAWPRPQPVPNNPATPQSERGLNSKVHSFPLVCRRATARTPQSPSRSTRLLRGRASDKHSEFSDASCILGRQRSQSATRALTKCAIGVIFVPHRPNQRQVYVARL